MKICSHLHAALWALLLCAPAFARAQSYPPAWSSSASYAIGDQVQLNGNVLRCTHAVTPGGFKYGDWELWDVRANTNVMIGAGQTFTTLTGAWAYILNARVADGVYLHLYIDTAKGDFNQTLPSAFSLDHAFGARISLLGDNGSNIALFFSGNHSDGLTIDNGHDFAAVSNIGLTGQFNPAIAIHASQNAVISSITGVTMAGWLTGLEADSGAGLFPSQTVTFINLSQTLFTATTNGIIDVPIENTIQSLDSVNIAFYATSGGHIFAELSNISNTLDEAVLATDGGYVDVSYSTFSACHTAVNADQSARVIAEGLHVSGDTGTDIVANHASTVDTGATAGLSTSIANGAQVF